MTMPPVENGAILTGVVEQVEMRDGAAIALVRVENASPLPPLPNPLASHLGEAVPLQITLDPGERPPATGDRIVCEARAAGPGRFFAQRGTVRSA